ncbi:DUF7410 domain-containing protein [Haloplanus halobius]|uniref:DUF7410 domain-containing protein n=1 Tax=Haloplanus halobius TaxID=2934938 RepID=UPI00201082AD|nr:DNA-binding protein [Haloplanus sp. XH21]
MTDDITPTDRAGTDADDVHVPPGATPHVCEYCGRPFTRETYLALHRGLEHPSSLSAEERDAFEDARATEEERLQRFRLLALAGVVALYFGFLLTYAVVT